MRVFSAARSSLRPMSSGCCVGRLVRGLAATGPAWAMAAAVGASSTGGVVEPGAKPAGAVGATMGATNR